MLRLFPLLICSFLGGCAFPGTTPDAPETVAPTVTTSGSQAKAQVLLIPSGGFTVADLSEQVVRVAHSGSSSVPINIQPSASKDASPTVAVLDDLLSHKVVTRLFEDPDLDSLGQWITSTDPDGLSLLTKEEYSTIRPDLLLCVRIFLADRSSAEEALLLKLSDSQLDSCTLRESFQAVLTLGVLWNSDQSARMQEKAGQLWHLEYSSGNGQRIDPDLPLIRTKVRQDISALVASGRISSALPTETRLTNGILFLKELEAQLVAERDRQTTLTAGETTVMATGADLRVVSIRFRSGRTVSMPLFLIRETSAGDVLLSAGDRVEFLTMQESSVFVRSVAADGNVLFVNRGRDASTHSAALLTGSPSALIDFLLDQSELLRDHAAPGPDVVVIRRIEQSGILHDFLIPVVRPGAQPYSAAASQMLKEVDLRQGDQLYLDNLGALPIVQESRAASLRFSQQQAAHEAARIAYQKKPTLEKLLQAPARILPNDRMLFRPQCDTVAAFRPAVVSEMHGNLSRAIARSADRGEAR